MAPVGTMTSMYLARHLTAACHPPWQPVNLTNFPKQIASMSVNHPVLSNPKYFHDFRPSTIALYTSSMATRPRLLIGPDITPPDVKY